MKYLKTYESVRHLMTGKSKEDLLDSIKDLTNSQKFDLACKNGVTWLVKDVLDKGVDPTKWLGSGVYNAVLYGHIDIVKLIFDNLIFKFNVTANVIDQLLDAAYNRNHKNIMKLILDSTTTKIKFDKRTYKYWSDKVKDMKVNESVRHLMTGKSEEDVKQSLEGLSPEDRLITAAKYGILWVVKDEIKKGNHIHYVLISAAINGQIEIVKYLLSIGYDIHMEREGALMGAIRNNNKEIVEFLLDNGADVNYYNETPLNNAIIYKYFDIANLLIKRGADIRKLKYKINPDSVTGADIKNFMEYHMIYEGVRDMMKPKSKDEINNIIKSWTSRERFVKGLRLNIPDAIQQAIEEMIPFEDVKVGDYLTISTSPGERLGFLRKILEKYTFDSLEEVKEYVKNFPNRLILTDTVTYAFNKGKNKNLVRVNIGVDLLFHYGENNGVFEYTEEEKEEIKKRLNEGVRDKMTPKSEEELDKLFLDSIKNKGANSTIITASKYGNLNGVKNAVKDGVGPHYYDEALEWACYSGNIDVVKYLISLGADINRKEGSCLLTAMANDNMDIFKYLLEIGILNNMRKDRFYYIRNIYTRNKNHKIEIINLLDEYWNKLNESIRDLMIPKSEEDIKKALQNTTPERKIILGIRNNMPGLVEDALKQPGQAWRMYYHQIMSYACIYGLTNIVKFMIDTKTSAIFIKEYLVLACVHNQIEVLKLLLDAGFNPFIILNDKELLPTIKNEEIIKLLKQYD